MEVTYGNEADSLTSRRQAGKKQVLEVSVTAAANAGADTLLATVTDHPCIIDSIVIHADAAQTVDLTSCPVHGGAAKVIEFIPAALAVQANLDAIDEQVAWTGAVRLAVAKTIVMVHNGTGATALDLTVIITYHSEVNGGFLV